MVKLTVAPNKYKEVAVVDLMADAFMGGRSAHPNKVITHRDGYSFDCSLHNLMWTTRVEIGKQKGGVGRRSVLKLDRYGNVLKIYRSVTECARKEFIDRGTLHRMLKKGVTADKSCTGFAYKYEDKIRKKREKCQ